jgi:hypothetical protein
LVGQVKSAPNLSGAIHVQNSSGGGRADADIASKNGSGDVGIAENSGIGAKKSSIPITKIPFPSKHTYANGIKLKLKPKIQIKHKTVQCCKSDTHNIVKA